MFLCLRKEARSRAHDGTDLVALGEGSRHQVLEGTGSPVDDSRNTPHGAIEIRRLCANMPRVAWEVKIGIVIQQSITLYRGYTTVGGQALRP